MDKNNTAILLIEFQKTWTEKGIFYKLIKKEYLSRNVLGNTKQLISAARKPRLKPLLNKTIKVGEKLVQDRDLKLLS